MMQFDRSMASGQCLFADAQRFRLELHWQQMAKPKLSELIERKFAAFQVEPGVEEVRKLRLGDWNGVGGELDDMVISRYMQYLEAEEVLVEVVFLWPLKTNLKLEQEILQSVEVESPLNGRRRWLAHSLDIMVPPALTLQSATFTPGMSQMTFCDTGGHVQEHFEFHQESPKKMESLRHWLTERAPGRLHVVDEQAEDCGEHKVVTIAGHYTKSVLPWPFSHRHGYVASGWFCPQDDRLFCHMRNMDHAEGLKADWRPDHLRCCSKLRTTNPV